MNESAVKNSRFEFRCTGCYQSLVADTDEIGAEVNCHWCSCSVIVPEPTDGAIERARAIEENPDELHSNAITFGADKELNREETSALARKLARDKKSSGRCRNPVAASASRLERLFAHIIDSIVALVVVFSCLALANKLQPTNANDLFTAPGTVHWQFWAVGIGGPIAYVLSSWFTISFFGKTIGKFAFNIKIVDSSGYAPGFLQGVVIRHSIAMLSTLVVLFPLLHYLDLWPDALVLKSKTSYELACLYTSALSFADIAFIVLDPARCLHDRLAGTYVING